MAHGTYITATLPADLVAFLDEYRAAHASCSLSEALADAVRALRDRDLQDAYRELGEAQRLGLETYPPDNLDGLGNAEPYGHPS